MNLLEKYFGVSLKSDKNTQIKNGKIKSFIPPNVKDGAITIDPQGFGYGGQFYSTSYNVNKLVNEVELITKYRQMSLHPIIDRAIDEICNEAIVSNGKAYNIYLNLDEVENLSDEAKDRIFKEFETIIKLTNYSEDAYNMFRQFYTDGRMYNFIHIDEENPKQGIQEIRTFDPRQIQLVRNIIRKSDSELQEYTNSNLIQLIDETEEFFIYNPYGLYNFNINSADSIPGIRLSTSSVSYINSGLTDEEDLLVLSHLEKASKVLNQLSDLEVAIIIYRLSRSAEKRIFYIDVGKMGHVKAAQYLKSIAEKYKTKLVYDASTGKVITKNNNHVMTEDYFLPRREGCFSLSTDICLLDGRTIPLSEVINEFNQGKDLWTYSVSPEGKVVPGQISWAGVTRKNSELIRITLDNGKSIDATPDHKFILRDGTKIEAKDLKENDSLMPFSFNKKKEYQIDFNIEQRKVVSIEFLSTKEDVGTLTVDKEEKYHDYHNYALGAGVFVMNSTGTEISTLPAGQNLGELVELEYFSNLLKDSLNVPKSRFDSNAGFNLGKSSEITREEISFKKFVSRLTNNFGKLFLDLLRVQLELKKIMSGDEFDKIKHKIYLDFETDNFFYELKEAEILQTRAETVNSIATANETYQIFSSNWIKKNIFKLTDEEINENNKEIESEHAERKKAGLDNEENDF